MLATSNACRGTLQYPSGHILDVLERAGHIAQRFGRHVGVSCSRRQLGMSWEPPVRLRNLNRQADQRDRKIRLHIARLNTSATSANAARAA